MFFNLTLYFSIVLTDGFQPVQSDLMCMTFNNFFEAREDEYFGMEGVSWVVINRADDPAWDVDICSVVYEPSHIPTKPVKCAFSWTCDGRDDVIKRQEKESFDLAFKAAYDVYSGDSHFDPTLGALYYRRCNLKNLDGWWENVQFTTKIGNHCFYK